MSTPPTPSAAPDPFGAMLRGAFLPTLLVGPIAIAIGFFTGGGKAALGAALGYAITIAFFGFGMVIMARFTKNQEPLIFMATALAVFFGQMIFLLVVILSLQNASWLDGRAFGFSALAVAVVWQIFQVWSYLRTRRPVYDEAPATPDTTTPEDTTPEDTTAPTHTGP